MNITIERIANTWHFWENGETRFYGYPQQKWYNIFSTSLLLKSSVDNKLISKSISTIFNPLQSILNINNCSQQIKIKWKNILYKPYIQIKQLNDQIYEIIPHENMSFSIYKDDKQVGSVLLPKSYLLNNEKLELYLNNNENKILIYSILLATICSFRETEIVNFNFGNTFREKYPFDANWQFL